MRPNAFFKNMSERTNMVEEQKSRSRQRVNSDSQRRKFTARSSSGGFKNPRDEDQVPTAIGARVKSSGFAMSGEGQSNNQSSHRKVSELTELTNGKLASIADSEKRSDEGSPCRASNHLNREAPVQIQRVQQASSNHSYSSSHQSPAKATQSPTEQVMPKVVSGVKPPI